MNFVSFENVFLQEYQNALQAHEKALVEMGCTGALSVIYYIDEFAKAQKSVDTGVAYGRSSFAALDSLT